MNLIEQIMWSDRAGLRQSWKPGSGSEASSEDSFGDPKEQIQRCLNCPYPECTNPEWCRYRREGVIKKKNQPKGYDREKIQEALKTVKTYPALAAILNVSTSQARACCMFYYQELDQERMEGGANEYSSHVKCVP